MTVHDTFRCPPSDCRPTPLYWWTGTDLDRGRLETQLDELAARGVGGTIVGYSHLPDGDLDHGRPAPLSEPWWELFRWFTEASAARGMTVGIQDYGLNGPMLRVAGQHTADLGSGTLEHRRADRSGPGVFALPTDGADLVTAVARDEHGTTVRLASTITGDELRFTLPAGHWEVSAVLNRPTFIGHHPSDFDPLHPDSGRRLIETFYVPFRDHLGPHFGTTFTTVFQDELDFGLRMPMWNALVGTRLAAAGFDHRDWLPALWRDLGDQTLSFRAAYRDVVVELLEDHYFRPIFAWHRQHGTAMLVDQVSRGDLRLGRRAYGDYLQTMRWYDGPGNDDPDLTTPRSVAAFKVSASIARLNDRPYVASEAFHSSGWGIAPAQILAGLNAGFGYGANHVIMHGLDYSSEGGWWEWASPDFHFRQPWWQHSEPLWAYVTRTSALLRWGRGVVDVAVLDPTQDLDLTGDAATSPEVAVAVLADLAAAGVDADLLDRGHLLDAEVVDGRLRVGANTYRALVVPDLRAVRADVLSALQTYLVGGGTLLVLGEPPARTEDGPVARSTWAGCRLLTAPELARVVLTTGEPDFDPRGSGLVAAHRRKGRTDLYLIVNVTADPVSAEVDVSARGAVEVFDAWDGTVAPGRWTEVPGRAGSIRVPVELAPGLATVVVVDAGAPPSASPPVLAWTDLAWVRGPWRVATVPVLDNRFGDYEYGGEPMGVETWHVDTASAADGPWTAAVVRDGPVFQVLGPVPPECTEQVEAELCGPGRSVAVPGPVDGLDLGWRPYHLSYRTGLADDPLLLDRMTGPHGLKGVPAEFLDPQACDPDAPAGSSYYFWSSVELPTTPVQVTAGARAAHRVWVGGAVLLDQPEEVPARRTPAWNLRDLGVLNQTRPCLLPPGPTPVLVRLVVSGTQPTRGSVAVGAQMPGPPPRARLRWWHGADPCLVFEPRPADPPDTVWVRVVSPPGLRAVELTVHGEVRSARLLSSGQPLHATTTDGPQGTTTVRLACADRVAATDVLLLEVVSGSAGFRGAAVLDGPLRWTLGVGTSPTSDVGDLGLRDFSGLVRFRTVIEHREAAGRPVRLSLPGLDASARVSLNGHSMGVVLTGDQELEVGAALRVGSNELEVEVATTLLNRFSVLPSPYARMQRPGGGFTAVRLRMGATAGPGTGSP